MNGENVSTPRGLGGAEAGASKTGDVTGDTLPAVSLGRVLAHCHALRLADGERVPPAAACRVEEGRIGVGFDETGPPFVHLLGPGAWFGIEAPPGRLVHRAVGSARVAGVGAAALQRALPDDVAGVRLALLQIERDRILALTAALLVADPLQRLAMRLVALCADIGGCDLDLTQADLAAMAALSRHTVNRALARLETDGVVVNHYRRIEVRDLDGLRAVIERDGRRRRGGGAR